MKFNYKIIFVAFLFLFNCADPDLGPVLTFENSGKGAYIKLISETTRLVNLLDEAAATSSTYTYSVELIDENSGNDVTEYRLDLVYDAVSGSDQTITGFRSFTPSDFVVSEAGNQAVLGVTITGGDILQALGLSYNDLTPGDNFTFKGNLTLENGQVHNFDNSSAAVRGNAFQAHFDFTIPAACPSDLTGTYEFETTNIWCGGADQTGTVEVEALGGGTYQFSDWAFGAYVPCYGGGGASGDLTFTEVCTEVSFTGFTDSFGDTWEYTSSISGNEWTIQWTNTYGESATSVIKYPGGGDWPISLAD